MVTTFNNKDFKSFGKYLFSKQRETLLKRNAKTSLDYEERFREVNDSDFQHWLAIQNEFKNITAVSQMCLESLDPDEYEAWEKAKNGLIRSRKAFN